MFRKIFIAHKGLIFIFSVCACIQLVVVSPSSHSHSIAPGHISYFKVARPTSTFLRCSFFPLSLPSCHGQEDKLCVQVIQERVASTVQVFAKALNEVMRTAREGALSVCTEPHIISDRHCGIFKVLSTHASRPSPNGQWDRYLSGDFPPHCSGNVLAAVYNRPGNMGSASCFLAAFVMRQLKGIMTYLQLFIILKDVLAQ